LNSVNAHYAQCDLKATIFNALTEAGKDCRSLKTKDLAGIDEFHVRGRQATTDLARDLGLENGTRVLDVGCGLGGAARYLAREFGCHVTGLDLNDEYCQVAEILTRRIEPELPVSFRQGNALDLPFPDAVFDIVWTQHSSMNISDKSGLYREIRRVMKPGGKLAVNDILAVPGKEVLYPVPWARDPSISFLVTSQQLLDILSDIGFEIETWRDTTDEGRAWFRRMREKIGKDGPPIIGLHLLLGPEFRVMARNQFTNFEEERIGLIEAVVRKPR